jgi:creatinine amidohydrolase
MSSTEKGSGVERCINNLPWTELTVDALRSDVVLVPVGAFEPHGYHAPVGLDNFVAEGIAQRIAEAADGYVFPLIPFGSVNSIYDFRDAPGSISLESRVLLDLYTNIGTELVRHGFGRVLFVNAHSGNAPLLQVAAFDIKDRSGGQVGILDWWSAAREVVDGIKGHSWGTHADEIETSILMATGGEDLVDLSLAVANSSELDNIDPQERDLYQRKILFTRKLDERWIGESRNMGDPSLAKVEHGQKVVDRCVEVGLQILEVLQQQSQLEHAPV